MKYGCNKVEKITTATRKGGMKEEKLVIEESKEWKKRTQKGGSIKCGRANDEYMKVREEKHEALDEERLESKDNIEIEEIKRGKN